MTVNARSEMDLEEDSILDKVAKASGANFGYHKEKARPMPEQGPVVSGVLYVPASPHQPPIFLCGAGISVQEGRPQGRHQLQIQRCLLGQAGGDCAPFPRLPGSRHVVYSVGGRGKT